MLIVYDFEGGDADNPTLTLRRWLTDVTDPDQDDFFDNMAKPCDVDSNSPPCWGDALTLPAGVAEARVNTSSVGMVMDDLTPPPGAATTSITETLGLNEFGEAGINLTAAGVFDENVCLGFGKAFAVSRSSGSSAQAQMKDLVGPGDINIANCGRVIIRKVTDPSGSTTMFSFGTTLDPSTFSLTGEGGTDSTQDYGFNVFAGNYSVTETVPSGWDLDSINCSASEVTNGSTYDTSGSPTVSFSLAALDTIDCTYTNEARSSLAVTKAVVNACDASDGTDFTLFIDGPEAGTGDKITSTGGDGTTVSDDDLVPGAYAVGEEGFTAANYTTSINTDADCVDGNVTLSAGEIVSCTITNVRRPTVTINKVVTGGSGLFDLHVDDGDDGIVEHTATNQGNGGSLGPVVITTLKSGSSISYGPVELFETAPGGGAISGYQTVWSCDDLALSNGMGTSIVLNTLLSGEDVTCTFTNVPTLAGTSCPASNP
jgi:hypothetical protein